MNTSYVLYDDANRKMETFGGPCRLSRWKSLPSGWSIEEFIGTVSRGMVSLDYVKRHAAELTGDAIVCEECGAACSADPRPDMRQQRATAAVGAGLYHHSCVKHDHHSWSQRAA